MNTSPAGALESFDPIVIPQMGHVQSAGRNSRARGGAVATATTAVADPVTLQNEAMNHYRAIEANTAATVARLDSVVAQLSRIVTTRGGRHGITAFIN